MVCHCPSCNRSYDAEKDRRAPNISPGQLAEVFCPVCGQGPEIDPPIRDEVTEAVLALDQNGIADEFQFTVHAGGTPWDVYQWVDKPFAVALRVRNERLEVHVMPSAMANHPSFVIADIDASWSTN